MPSELNSPEQLERMFLEMEPISKEWLLKSAEHRYSYNFSWMGRPVIQYPQDLVAYVELIWETKPDLVIETGVAHGGSLTLVASVLSCLDLSDSMARRKEGTKTIEVDVNRKVIGIEVDLRDSNRESINSHPLKPWIELVSGSSIDPEIFSKVRTKANKYKRIMVCLDSDHTREHVLKELELYAPLVSGGSYCLVFDTSIELGQISSAPVRPWAPGNSPKNAVDEFLSQHPEFEVDHEIDMRLLISAAPGGYLRKVSGSAA